MKAFVFPGQGSQFVGMAKEHYDQNSNVRELFDQADEILGFSLTNIMFDGPEDTLKQTEYTQAAIYLHSIALYMDQGETPSCVAGHSLGEFTALTAAGVLSFEQGLCITYSNMYVYSQLQLYWPLVYLESFQVRN